MARWKLTEPHYLNVVGRSSVEWESKETNRETGRQAVTRFKVPRLLDPKDPADFNYKDDGIIVCHPGKGQRLDIEFEGPPTPSMEPLDDEAQALSDAERPNWHDPINEFSAMSYSDRLLESLSKRVAEQEARTSVPIMQQSKGVDAKAFADLQEKVAMLLEQNAQLQARLLEKPVRRL
jgi:hypothetical protein